MISGPTYYLCPFCVSSWVCDGPHIEEKDVGNYYKKISLIKEDFGEYAKELILKNGESLNLDQLATLVEVAIKNRNTI